MNQHNLKKGKVYWFKDFIHQRHEFFLYLDYTIDRSIGFGQRENFYIFWSLTKNAKHRMGIFEVFMLDIFDP